MTHRPPSLDVASAKLFVQFRAALHLWMVASAATISMGCSPPAPSSQRTGSGGAQGSAAEGELRFVRGDDAVRQTLDVSLLDPRRARIEVAIEGDCQRLEHGIGILQRAATAPAVEIDEAGTLHAADEIEIEPRPGCRLSVLLDMEGRERAWVRESGCAVECPIHDVVMHRD